MKANSKALRILEGGLLCFGLLLLVVFAFAHIHRFIMFRAEMARFEARQLESPKGVATGMKVVDGAIPDGGPHQAPKSEYSTWSIQRTKSYQANLGKPVESLAVLRIPALHLEVPVLEGTDAVTLNRGVGRIARTSLPGQRGNIGIAGHRDGFFRRLKDIRNGDAIELVTISGTDVFVVDQIRITSPADVSALRPKAKYSLTLVTCYPFYYVGPAPSRYIVEASLKRQPAQDEE
jgi:sortase A